MALITGKSALEKNLHSKPPDTNSSLLGTRLKLTTFSGALGVLNNYVLHNA